MESQILKFSLQLQKEKEEKELLRQRIYQLETQKRQMGDANSTQESRCVNEEETRQNFSIPSPQISSASHGQLNCSVFHSAIQSASNSNTIFNGNPNLQQSIPQFNLFHYQVVSPNAPQSFQIQALSPEIEVMKDYFQSPT